MSSSVSQTSNPARSSVDRVTIRFAGDSGDGIQLIGGQFTLTTATLGNDLATFPDYPAEIRAPAGTKPGVSGFQIQLASGDVHTPGDQPDVLVAFNPAALSVNVKDMPANALVIVNSNSFDEADVKRAQLASNPLDDGSLSKFRVIKVPMTDLTLKALETVDITHKEKERCKNFFALGVVYSLYGRPLETTLKFFEEKFGKKNPQVRDANSLSLKAGYGFAEATELFHQRYEVPPAKYAKGTYRNISGNEAVALGLVTGAHLAGRPLFYGSYPITPASDILHELAKHKNFGVITFQAEDEIAAVTSSVGASYAGSIGVTGTSGPGVALKSEAINLAVMLELPLVIVDVQRGGPSTGLPTKTEQADLLQAMYGRNSESPVAIFAPATPSECFDISLTAIRIAVKYMCPVFVMSDGYLANGAEPWLVPNPDELPRFPVTFHTQVENFGSYKRNNATLARPWAIPGTPGLMHRVGGIEKWDGTGHISYDAANHDHMCRVRAEKIAKIAQDLPDLTVHGPADADTLVLGWGSTYGAIRAGVEAAQAKGMKVARAHLRYLNPFPKNTEAVLRKYKRIVVPEMNLGQLSALLRNQFLINVEGLNKVEGQPFRVNEILSALQNRVN